MDTTPQTADTIGTIANVKSLTLSGFLFESFADNIAAFPGGGQANATQLGAELNKVTTVANPGDSVKLPASAPGLTIICINKGASAMQVFGLGGDVVDDSPAAVGVSQMRNSTVIYSCATAGTWATEGLGGGFTSSGGGAFQTFSFVDGLTATAAGTQATSIVVQASQAGFATVAAGAAAKLPPAKAGMQIDVINHGLNTLTIFPASQTDGGVVGGDAFNTQAQNAALTGGITITVPVIFYCMTDGVWWTK
jgi:hypothetical protein